MRMRNDWWSGVGRGALVLVVLWGLVWSGCSKKKAPERRVDEEARRVGAPSSPETQKSEEEAGPKRIIMMIGDGMGAAAISGASYASEEPLEMLSMERLNYLTTHSYEYVTTDSAASATAFATGKKTHYEGVSVKPGTTRENEENEEQHLKTALEVAEGRGWKTGLVATARIVHATPAAFGSHRANRHRYEEIARDMSQSGVDLLLGGGRKYFQQRSDGAKLLDEMSAAGMTLAKDAEEFRQARGVATRLAGLFSEKDPPGIDRGERPVDLPGMTGGAIEVLDRENDRGFFLMVEGSQIDWREHDLSSLSTIEETLDFDRAVGEVLEYARGRDDTLVIVVADHETGGLSILDRRARDRYAEALGGGDRIGEMIAHQGTEPGSLGEPMPVMERAGGVGEGSSDGIAPVFGHLSLASRKYVKASEDFWSIHTPEMIPMFVEGPGADYLAEAGDNAEVGRRLHELINGERATGRGPQPEDPPSSRDRPPSNAILFVGDGLGLDPVTTAHYTKGPLAMRTMPTKGLVSTGGRQRLVPGESVAGTALATGVSTVEGGLSVEVSGGKASEVASVLERAERNGYRTGIVTTDRLTNPTVAAHYAHGEQMPDQKRRASAFAGLAARVEGSDGIDLAYGGGAGAFDGSVLARLEGQGVDVGTTWDEGGARDRQVVRLLADGRLPGAAERGGDEGAGGVPSLEEMTRAAIERLADGERPFFLIVEADGMGRLQRAVDRSGAIAEEVAAFDRAVEAGLSFARRDKRTLVVATADRDYTMSVFDNHYGFNDRMCGIAKRCGGPMELIELPVAVEKLSKGLTDSSLQGQYAPPRLFVQYAWPVQAAHRSRKASGVASANFVPLFAEGPWAKRLEGGIDQREVGALLVDWADSQTIESTK